MKRRAFFTSVVLPLILLLKRRDPLCVGYIRDLGDNGKGWRTFEPVLFPDAQDKMHSDPMRGWYLADPREPFNKWQCGGLSCI